VIVHVDKENKFVTEFVNQQSNALVQPKNEGFVMKQYVKLKGIEIKSDKIIKENGRFDSLFGL